MRNRTLSECFGKKTFASANAAYAMKSGRKYDVCSVYRCSNCTQWHIGSNTMGAENDKARQRDKRYALRRYTQAASEAAE